jgi:hypothetical protein
LSRSAFDSDSVTSRPLKMTAAQIFLLRHGSGTGTAPVVLPARVDRSDG